MSTKTTTPDSVSVRERGSDLRDRIAREMYLSEHSRDLDGTPSSKRTAATDRKAREAAERRWDTQTGMDAMRTDMPGHFQKYRGLADAALRGLSPRGRPL